MPISTPSYRANTSSIAVASKTYSGTQDTLRHLAVLRSTAWCVIHRPSFPSWRRSATSATTSHALVNCRLCMPRAALATKVTVVLWNRGTCLHTVKMCAVAPPLCRLYKEEVAQLAYLAFIPHREWGGWVRLLRLMTAAKPHERFFNASSGTRSVFGRWAARVNDAIGEEDHARVVGDLPPFISPPTGNDHEYVIHNYNLSHHIAAPRPAVNPHSHPYGGLASW